MFSPHLQIRVYSAAVNSQRGDYFLSFAGDRGGGRGGCCEEGGLLGFELVGAGGMSFDLFTGLAVIVGVLGC